ncbi:hypothetical protein [Aurantivibrio infirmus]
MRSKDAPRLLNHQGGWLMPVAAFIVVAMGLLAAAMSVVNSQTSISGAQEQVSVQTFYAAESGAQLGMNRLFYDVSNPISRANASANCAAINGTSLNFSVPGMQACRTSITCQVSIDGADSISFYSISSAATCGGSPVYSQRTVEVSAFLR